MLGNVVISYFKAGATNRTTRLAIATSTVGDRFQWGLPRYCNLVSLLMVPLVAQVGDYRWVLLKSMDYSSKGSVFSPSNVNLTTSPID